MADIVSLGYTVDTAQVLKGDKALDGLTASTLQADKATKKFATSAQMSSAAMAKTARHAANLNTSTRLGSQGVRNLGLQLNQVAQQGAVTGNYIQALAIQLPDLLLGFGTIGIFAGIAAGALGPLALSFLRVGDSAKAVEGNMDDLGEAIANLENFSRILNSSNSELVEEFGFVNDSLRETIQILEELARGNAQSALDDLGASLSSLLQTRGDGDSRSALADFFDVNIFFAVSREARNARDEARQLTFEFQRTQEALAAANGNAEEQASLLVTLTKQARELAELNGEVTEEERNFVNQLAEGTLQAQQLSGAVGGIADETRIAREQAEGLSAALNRAMALNPISAAQRDEDSVFSQDVVQDADGRAGQRGAIDNFQRLLEPRRASSRDPYEQNLNRLIESLRTERETLEVWYAESEILLNDHRARKLLGEEEYREALLALDEEYSERQTALADRTAQHEINAKQAAVNGISGLLSVLTGKSRAAAIALVAVSKAQAIAQAIQNTKVAQLRALAELGPVHGSAAAAKIGAYGKVQIAAIAATGLAQALGAGGGSGGAAAGAEGVSATEARAEPEQPRRILLDFNGSPSWVEDMFRDITARIQEESDTGTIFEVSR